MAGHGTVIGSVGAAAEGTDARFGVPGSALFGQAATASGDGAANASYDSFASLAGGVLLMNMMLGEVAPGGAGSGLYGLVVMTLLAVFLGGLMVGTTPEFLKKRLHARHMKLIGLYVVVLPAAVLIGCAIAMALPGQVASMLNTGPHGLSEVLYAFTSPPRTTAARSVGSAATPSGTTSRWPLRWPQAGSSPSSWSWRWREPSPPRVRAWSPSAPSARTGRHSSC
jgi:K+-transporting ATPase ATPase A chain